MHDPDAALVRKRHDLAKDFEGIAEAEDDGGREAVVFKVKTGLLSINNFPAQEENDDECIVDFVAFAAGQDEVGK